MNTPTRQTPFTPSMEGNEGQQHESLVDRVQQAARSATNETQDVLEKARHEGAKATSQVAGQVDEAMTATGERMTDLAQTVREHAPQGTPGEIARNAANTIERSGQYLQEADLTRVRDDVEQFVRTHPTEALLIGFGVGFLVARAMRR